MISPRILHFSFLFMLIITNLVFFFLVDWLYYYYPTGENRFQRSLMRHAIICLQAANVCTRIFRSMTENTSHANFRLCKFLRVIIYYLVVNKIRQGTFFPVSSKLAMREASLPSAILFVNRTRSKYGIVHQIWKTAVVSKAEISLKEIERMLH